MKDKTSADKLSKLSSKSSSSLPQRNAPNLFVTKSLDKNLSTLHLYNSIFGDKYNYFNHIGDANTHFKKTLRKYNEFNGLKNTKWLENKCRKLKPKFNKKEHRQAAGDAIRAIYTDKAEEKEDKEALESSEALDEDLQQQERLSVESLSKERVLDQTDEEFFEETVDKPQEELQKELKKQLQTHLKERSEQQPQDEDPKEDVMADEEHDCSITAVEVQKIGDLIQHPEDVDALFIKSIEAMKRAISEKSTASDPRASGAVYPHVDTKVMSELEDAECQARQTANVINDLKQRVTELLCKNHMTDKEAEELEEMNRQLTEHMSKFEEKTKLIQMLVNTADQQIRMLPEPKKHKEDMLPKVVICGMTENNMPKILICESKKQKRSSSTDRRRTEGHPQSAQGYLPTAAVVPQIAKRLSQSYDMQEKLAADNIDLEGKRYELQEQLMSQDKTVEGLQRQLCTMQQELRVMCKENSILTEKLERIQGKCKNHPELPCGSIKGVCPADVENRLQHYQNATSTLERQVELMEDEVKRMQEELVAVRRERAEIEYRRLAKEVQGSCKPSCPGPCRGAAGGPTGCCAQTPTSMCTGMSGASCNSPTCATPPMCPTSPCPTTCMAPCTGPCMPSSQETTNMGTPCPGPCLPSCQGTPSKGSPCSGPLSISTPCTGPPTMGSPAMGSPYMGPPCMGPPCMAEQQLRELREQYNRLQDDYKSKLVEVAGLRADNETAKRSSKENERLKRELDCKLEEMEREIKAYRAEKSKMTGSKEMMVEQEQQLTVAKQRFREAQDELDELRACIQDQATQLDDYRNKYLTAQQQVEEQRRQIDVMEMENARIGEQVTCEIQRVKAQFQERLAELAPLPDILKATQLKLQEEQHCRGIAERNSDTLARELQMYKDKLACLVNQMEKQRNDQQLGEDERMSLMTRISGWECKCSEIQAQNDRFKTEMTRMEEQLLQAEKRFDEKLHEVAQLTAQLDNVREESARQVTRTKERCETVRRSLQAQVAELERQLAQSRAAARAAQKDRDEIRHKMQAQITNLNDNFEEAQLRIRSLQGHVNFLKSSYTTMFGGDGPQAAPCAQPIADDDSTASCNCTSTYT